MCDLYPSCPTCLCFIAVCNLFPFLMHMPATLWTTTQMFIYS